MKKSPVKKKAAQKSTKRKPRRMDWQLNDDLIESTFIRLMMAGGGKPSYEDIARELKVNVQTIKRHVKECDFKERFQIYRLATPKVIMNLFKQSATGKNDKMIKMWLEQFEGLGEKKELTVKGDLFKVYQGIDPSKV